MGPIRDLLKGALCALLALTAVAAVLSPPAAAAPPTALKIYTVLKPSAASVLARSTVSTEWGGAIRATNGETVTIYFSDSYPVDPALGLKWADFMTSLVHGSELSTVTVYIAPLAEVQRYCGRNALACYSSDSQTIVAPGEDPDPQTSAEGVLTHEYGHHVASSRLNPPFTTVDYGTKRWASYETSARKQRPGSSIPAPKTRSTTC